MGKTAYPLLEVCIGSWKGTNADIASKSLIIVFCVIYPAKFFSHVHLFIMKLYKWAQWPLVIQTDQKMGRLPKMGTKFFISYHCQTRC